MLKRRGVMSFVSLICAMSLMVGCGAKEESNSAPSAPQQSKPAYPEKEITLIVPFAAGGGNDVIGRQVAAQMEKELGKPVMVVNKEGGGGLVGFQEIAKAKPDGYTIGMVSNSMLLQKYANDAHQDYKAFAPIAVISYDPATLSVKKDAPWQSAKEFVDQAVNEPGKMGIANAGPGGIWHVSALVMSSSSGAKFKHVPFKGGNPAAVAVAGGHVQATFTSPGEVKSMVDSGDLRILAVASEERLANFPDIPTLKEQGIDTVIGNWRGFVAPKGTPAETIAALEKAVEKAVNSQEFKDFMDKGSYGIRYIPANEFGPFMEKEDATYAELLKDIKK